MTSETDVGKTDRMDNGSTRQFAGRGNRIPKISDKESVVAVLLGTEISASKGHCLASHGWQHMTRLPKTRRVPVHKILLYSVNS